MIKIVFKDVGQGDSIIVHWTKEEVNHLGIIDCKKTGSNNPVIEYLSSLVNIKIHFILLTHPHFDHYSGILDLLEFCESKKINIYRFLHTLDITPSYLNYVSDSEEDLVGLTKIIDKSERLEKIGIINTIGIDATFKLTDTCFLKCLSPSGYEKRQFCEKIDYYKSNTYQCSQAANYLSTVIKIDLEDSFIFLTSDSEKTTFERLYSRNNEEFKNKKIILGQIPHHGSLNNHHETFWEDLYLSDSSTAVISVGNNKHGHPSYEVIKFFHNTGYKINATCILNGHLRFLEELTSTVIKSMHSLDDLSEIVVPISSRSDLIYEIA